MITPENVVFEAHEKSFLFHGKNMFYSWDIQFFICDALRDLAPFVQFKIRENTHGQVLLLVKSQATKSISPLWMFFRFFKW